LCARRQSLDTLLVMRLMQQLCLQAAGLLHLIAGLMQLMFHVESQM